MNNNNNKDNITIGLPKPGGAVYWAPLGTELPTDATTELSSEYVNLGYVSEDGVTLSTSESIDEIKAWGRETVMISSTDYGETATINFLETIRESTLKFIRGAANVSVSGDTAYAKTTGDPLPRGVLVIDTLQNNGGVNPKIHRILMGDAQVSDRSGDQSYNNSNPLTYPAVVRAFKYTSAVNGSQVYKEDFWGPAESEVSG